MSKHEMIAPPAPSPVKSIAAEPIPVALLRWKPRETVAIPGSDAATSVATTVNPVPSQRRYVVEYMPWMRHHRITHYPPGAGQAAEVMYIHETWCTWVPG